MKLVKLLSIYCLSILVFASCDVDFYTEDDVVYTPAPTVTLEQVVSSYDLWYVDIEQTSGSAYIPFMEKAFTLSFRGGDVWANNNLAGIGSQGNGYGIPVGYYDIFDHDLDISHDIDGFFSFEVNVLSSNSIELYYRPGNTSFILKGYQRSTFDYDRLFYDNVHFFLQEYAAWEKIYTSDQGALNEFDAENFLQFLPASGGGNFKSSQDHNGTSVANVYWDYTGIYDVENVSGDPYLKYLTLDYDYFSNEYFELTIINDNTIELYHQASGTVYRFRGKGYIQYKAAEEGKPRVKEALIAKQIEELKALKS
ncbi:MAG: nicotinic acid mononucleotide adenyltransferase [Cytophagaceae bacterium]|nr:nicotinic acid mononucleotide adenyltransferase [Cytophagaceae bacterium]|tara:strand:+ start:10497 stop:11426 length:930 start_codon:yes stop_codon:yes gene_type:complete